MLKFVLLFSLLLLLLLLQLFIMLIHETKLESLVKIRSVIADILSLLLFLFFDVVN